MRKNKNNGWKAYIKLYLLVMLAITLFMGNDVSFAKNDDASSKSYTATILDDADLLDDEQESSLYETMEQLTEYGNVVFCSSNTVDLSEERYAKSVYEGLFDNQSGTIFLIDMKNRELYIYSKGAMFNVISRSYANTITDNVYKFATAGDYFSCANMVFSQEYDLFRGAKIRQPMKYISNFLFAVILSVLINYLILRKTTQIAVPESDEILEGLNYKQRCDGINFTVKSVDKVRISSDSSSHHHHSGGGGGGFGGGGFSGGSRGGGGGHSF